MDGITSVIDNSKDGQGDILDLAQEGFLKRVESR